MAATVLWHLKFSHFNEKVRWALDHKRVPHVRRAPLPALVHPLVALAKTRAPTLPVLELDGEAIGDTTRIIAALERRHPDPPLYPGDPAQRARALELEKFFDEEVGPYARRLAFYEMSRDRELAGEGADAATAGALAPPLVRLAAPAMLTANARRYGARPGNADEARERIRRGFERIESEVGPSGYLVGETFTVADLTAASLLLHYARPPEFEVGFPRYPEPLERFRRSLPREGMEWVRRIWREHRRRPGHRASDPRYTS